jgi:hypothetical protein
MTTQLLHPDVDLAIVGAGASAAALVTALRELPTSIAVFEKSRGPGGRLSVRRTALANYNHGGLPGSHESSAASLESVYKARLEGRAFSAANSEIKRALSDVSTHYGTRIDSIQRTATQWRLVDKDGQTIALSQALVIALPAPQALALLPEGLPAHWGAQLSKLEYDPAWALMLSFQRAIEEVKLKIDYALPLADFPILRKANPIAGADLAGSRAWSLIASPQFSRRALEWAPDEVVKELLRQTGIAASDLDECLAHRWRYAQPAQAVNAGGFWSEQFRFGAVGDYFGALRLPPLQRAILSAQWLAEQIKSSHP